MSVLSSSGRALHLAFIIFQTRLRTPSSDRRVLLAACVEALASRASGAFLKLGQLLSTRPELVGEKGCERLSLLLDRAPPQPWGEIERAIRSSGISIEASFTQLSETPHGSASIAQVHRATLVGGLEVAVKVLRPGIGAQITADVRLARALLIVFSGLHLISRKEVDIVLGELRMRVNHETDFVRERLAQETMARELALQPSLHTAPRTVAALCNATVIVSEWVHGDTAAAWLRKQQRSSDDLAGIRICEGIWKSVLSQLFQGDFFHGDPHAGNIMLVSSGGDLPLTWIDFGLVGHTTPSLRRKLLSLFRAFQLGSVEEALDALRQMGLEIPDVGAYAVERDLLDWLAACLDDEAPWTARSFAKLLGVLRPLIERSGGEVDFLVRTFRTLYAAEATVRSLSPGFNSQRFVRGIVVTAGETQARRAVLERFLRAEIARTARLLEGLAVMRES